jgi:hypothetical protein
MKLLRDRLLLILGLLAVGLVAAIQTPACPIDKTNMQWTGNTRQEMGKTLAEFKCIHGHIYWFPAN